MVIRNQGEGILASDLVQGLMNEWSAVSALRFCGRDEPIMKALEFCVLPQKQDFERIDTVPHHLDFHCRSPAFAAQV